MGRTQEEGSAVVEFALVVPLVLLVFLAIVQVAVAGFVRTTLTASAAEGARAGALSGSDLRTAERRTHELAEESMVSAAVVSIDAQREARAGMELIVVTIEAKTPVAGLLGPATQTIVAHAIVEDR